jgi:hypothetical protein
LFRFDEDIYYKLVEFIITPYAAGCFFLTESFFEGFNTLTSKSDIFDEGFMRGFGNFEI